MGAWAQVVDFFAGVPAGVWVAAMTANLVLTGGDVVGGASAGPAGG